MFVCTRMCDKVQLAVLAGVAVVNISIDDHEDCGRAKQLDSAGLCIGKHFGPKWSTPG